MAPVDDDSCSDLVDRSRRALREGRLDEARTLAEAALETLGSRGSASSGSSGSSVSSGLRRSAGDEASLLAILGEVELRKGGTAEALAHIEASLALAPRPFTASLAVRALFRSGRWDEGVARCRGFLRSNPDNPYLGVQEAQYHIHAGEFERACEILESVLARSPDLAMARELLIQAKMGEASPQERVRELEDLFRVESRRNDPQLRYLQGKNRLEGGDLEGACEEFAAAAELAPENKFYRRQLAFTLRKAGLLDRAVPALRDLFVDDPADVYVRGAFQSACKSAGQAALFAEAVREALRLHPDKAFLHGILRKAGKGGA